MTANSTLPGNICLADAQCINGTCNQNNTCVITASEGSNCYSGNKVRNNTLCPPSLACGSDGKCRKKLEVNAQCGNEGDYLLCPAHTQCIKAPYNETQPRCQGLGLVKKNDTYNCGSGSSCSALVCETGRSLQDKVGDTTFQRCMPAPFNLNKTAKAYPLSTQCVYTDFEDPSNITKTVNKEQPAKCGFNKDGMAYCDVLPGDINVLEGL